MSPESGGVATPAPRRRVGKRGSQGEGVTPPSRFAEPLAAGVGEPRAAAAALDPAGTVEPPVLLGAADRLES
jgi:hypothetical protein